MFLLVGLGNPGKKYENTRHNVGFQAVDEIIRRFSFSDAGNKFQSLCASGMLGNKKLFIIKPQTYMNRSGSAVQAATAFYKIPPQNIVVIHDDLDLAVGKVKAKLGGGAGGNNGLKDIDRHLGQNYRRIRIGIGHPGDRDIVADHVLQPIPKRDRPAIDAVIDAIAEHLEPAFGEEFPANFMNQVSLKLNPPTHQPKPTE